MVSRAPAAWLPCLSLTDQSDEEPIEGVQQAQSSLPPAGHAQHGTSRPCL